MPLKSFGYNTNIGFIDVRIGIRNIKQDVTLSSPVGFYLYEKDNLNSEIMEIPDKEILIKVNNDSLIDIFDYEGELIDTISNDGSILIGSRDLFYSTVQVDKNKYRGYIFFLTNNGNMNIINHVHMEEYLYGVVPREIPASSQHEALKAQAVVARSYAYVSMNNHINDGYNLCNTTHCQVYGGFDGEHPSTNQAVKDTYGDYVSFNGDIISTPYHSNSGGHTEDSVKVWGGSFPYLVGVSDEYSTNAPNSSWTMNITPREIQNQFASVGIDIGQILDIKIEETTNSNRVTKIRITGSKKEEIMTGERFRSIMGNTYLKSTLFSVKKEGGENPKKTYIIDGYGNSPKEIDLRNKYIIDGEGKKTINRNGAIKASGKNSSVNLDVNSSVIPATFILEGKGYGHGVGMSQYGAMEMAKQGYNYSEIIKHYYRGVEIINLGK